MKHTTQTGAVITVPCPSGGITSGKILVIGSLIGVALNTAAVNEDVDLQTEGVTSYPKASSLTIAVGDKLYFKAADNVVNKTSTDNTLVGIAVAAAASNDSTVLLKLGATTV